jgi:outer membrane protein OmpA-like peptidoglycan-associated protein
MAKRITQTAALAALMAGGAGAAEATEGWYGRIDLGYSLDGEAEVAGPQTFESDSSQGVAMGYALDNGFRFEGEVSHRFNRFEPGPSVDGDIHAWTGMLNGYYDFNRGGGIEPYVGVGVGSARLNASAFEGPVSPRVDDDVAALAYQGMAGIAFGLGEQLDIDVGYRYLAAPDAGFNGTTPTTKYTGDYVHQAVTVGLRYQFDAPQSAPPPPPPPVFQAPPPRPMLTPPVEQRAACPTSEFVVYFEWDRSNLNQAALETIDAAVTRARQCDISAAVVVGHTDTSGSPTYNQALSDRRASVVRDAMVARGMGSGAIRAEARGESAPARATRDGVREPLNRRTAVTITFR